jgi:HK97 family phage prohead protease/HK97 family phage major capsid protein
MKGMENFIKNPILLAYHDHSKPVGKVIDYKVSDAGLYIKGRISKASGEIYALVKDGTLSAFSVSFRLKDGNYDSKNDIFVISELELIEISVVSVPANANTLFKVSKAFETAEEFEKFKSELQQSTTKELSTPAAPQIKGIKMEFTKEELATIVADAVKSASAVSQASTTGAELLVKDVQAKLEAQDGSINELKAALAEKAAEIANMQKSKMQFPASKEVISADDKVNAVLLSKMMGKGITDTKFGKELMEKAGAHVATANFETEVASTLEHAVKQDQLVAPLFRQIIMGTNTMKVPVIPESGLGTWMANTAFGTSTSAGSSYATALVEAALNAYKVASTEYVAFEEEEDSLFAIMPFIRESLVRRLVLATDRAFIRGAGSGADPVAGLASYDATSAVTVAATSAAAISNMVSLRRDLGTYGIKPSEVVYIVSNDVYYDLLADSSFQTVDKIGTQATFLTGQVGQIGASPVVVSDQFPTKAASSATGTTNIAALAVNIRNFVVGNQRGVRLDTQDLVETQRKVLVASMRTGLVGLTAASGVSVLRWV